MHAVTIEMTGSHNACNVATHYWVRNTPSHTHTHLHTHTHTLAHTHTYTHTHLHTNKPTHQCCDPPLPAVPDGNWYCANCVARHSSQLHSHTHDQTDSPPPASQSANSDNRIRSSVEGVGGIKQTEDFPMTASRAICCRSAVLICSHGCI